MSHVTHLDTTDRVPADPGALRDERAPDDLEALGDEYTTREPAEIGVDIGGAVKITAVECFGDWPRVVLCEFQYDEGLDLLAGDRYGVERAENIWQFEPDNAENFLLVAEIWGNEVSWRRDPERITGHCLTAKSMAIADAYDFSGPTRTSDVRHNTADRR